LHLFDHIEPFDCFAFPRDELDERHLVEILLRIMSAVTSYLTCQWSAGHRCAESGP
jgi:hypothetical protein